ncbi:hypothetical protein ASF21_16020 [Arthrobacter sp. Leaf234]|nr:hypothetical protein ASF21_16020 [Arthrobacter sp. Leaf234]
MSAVDVVACVDPLPRLLILRQPRVQPPVDTGPVKVQELRPVNPECRDSCQALVRAHQDREVRVREQDRIHPRQREHRHGYRDAEELPVEALTIGETRDCSNVLDSGAGKAASIR